MMSSKSRKRSRTIADENRADCPFTVTSVATPSSYDERDHSSKKRKRDGPDEGKELVQVSPFRPQGKFKAHQNMDLAYVVEPRKRWLDMTRYNSFVLNNLKYCNDDYVYIANDATIERQKSTTKDADHQSLLQSADYWVARILEIRAMDEHHVYARVYWMYSPDEIPAGTSDGKKLVTGRQPYHGQNELIASNHMDVINVVSVAMRAVVNEWIETDDDQVQDALYWRQAFDCRASQLSSVNLTCKCKTPANPDKTLVGCTNSACGTWLHYECLLHDVLMRVYERLGTDKLHRPKEVRESSPVKAENDDKPPAALRTSTPADIKGEDSNHNAGIHEGENGDGFALKQVDGITPKTTESPAPAMSAPLVDKISRSASIKKGRPRRAVERPYEGLFEATLKLDEGPTTWCITDLRGNVSVDHRTWTENADCLICGHRID